jgi:hypothetical protein
MSSSLGIYIDNSMIKYAKLSKEKDSIKVDSFNVMFYDNLSKALEQIIEETDAYKIPICSNIGNEIYGYVEVFAELSKKDIKSSVGIEFEMDCSDKNYNADTLEMRYLLMADAQSNEKYRALYIATEKAELSKRAQVLSQYKLDWMTPISHDIINLLDIGPKEDIAIVNIEDETKITTIIKGSVTHIDAVNIGMHDILSEINKTENSLAKSYEICKNLTIYTQDMKGEAIEGNEHLETVMPILHNLVDECKKIFDDAFGNIQKVYITGSATVINNLDLYFQEFLPQMKCEILRPYFLEGGTVKTSIKDYIEVNSAMALALNTFNMGLKDINYATSAATVGSDLKMLSQKYINVLKGRLGLNRKKPKEVEKEKFNLKEQFVGPLDPVEKTMIRGCVVTIAAVIGLLTFSFVLDSKIKDKTAEVADSMEATSEQLMAMSQDTSKINDQTLKYNTLITLIEGLNNPTSGSKTVQTTFKDRIIAKNSIPNLLTGIMTKIPQKVQVTLIQNTEEKHIVIQAQSAQYEQLGFFKGLITTNNILTNVKSTSGEKDGDLVKITIEGDLP